MKVRTGIWVGAVALAASATVYAQQSQVDRAFTATGASCDQVTWSREALQSYPNVARACREVMERDGTYFVRFEGEVRRVADRGREVTIDFRDGDRLTLTPPENLSITIDGRPTEPRNLRPGDQLTFYIPQNQLAATFFPGQPEPATAQPVPIRPAPAEPAAGQRVAAATPAGGGVLPRTASSLPMLGVAGLMLIVLGAVLTARRAMRPSV
jgi:hypothetical protein